METIPWWIKSGTTRGYIGVRRVIIEMCQVLHANINGVGRDITGKLQEYAGPFRNIAGIVLRISRQEQLFCLFVNLL